MSTKLDKSIDGLTNLELRFMRYHIVDSMILGEAYKKTHPKSKMGKDNLRRAGWQFWKDIKAKFPNWASIFEMHGIGPTRMVKVLNEALEATTSVVRGNKVYEMPDHKTRVYASKQLQEIHGLAEQTVNIKTDEPLPLVVIIDGKESNGEEC